VIKLAPGSEKRSAFARILSATLLKSIHIVMSNFGLIQNYDLTEEEPVAVNHYSHKAGHRALCF
jgi:hypothetical protein